MDPTSAVPSTYGIRRSLDRAEPSQVVRVLDYMRSHNQVWTPAKLATALDMADEDVIQCIRTLGSDGFVDETSSGWVARHPKAGATISPDEDVADPGTVIKPDAQELHLILREIVGAIRADGRQRLHDLRTQVEATPSEMLDALALGVRLGTLTTSGRGGGTWYDVPRATERQVETLVQLEPPPSSPPDASGIVDGWLADLSQLGRMALSTSDRARLVRAIQEALDAV